MWIELKAKNIYIFVVAVFPLFFIFAKIIIKAQKNDIILESDIDRWIFFFISTLGRIFIGMQFCKLWSFMSADFLFKIFLFLYYLKKKLQPPVSRWEGKKKKNRRLIGVLSWYNFSKRKFEKFYFSILWLKKII